jgi:hypothetical protein
MVFVRFKILNACRRCRAAAPRQRFSKDWLGCLFCLREGDRENLLIVVLIKLKRAKVVQRIKHQGPHPTAAPSHQTHHS